MRVFGQRQEVPVKPRRSTLTKAERKQRSLSDLMALAEDKRKYRRIKVRLSGRFMRENQTEYPCYTNDISAGGISLSASVKCVPGEYIVLYIEEIGRLEAIVVRNHDGGFAVAIEATTYKREKLVATLTWLLNKHELEGTQTRQHERMVPINPHSTLITANGKKTEAEVLDLSMGGARINVNVPVKPGEKVVLGKSSGYVVRIDDDGIAIQFETRQSSQAMCSYFL